MLTSVTTVYKINVVTVLRTPYWDVESPSLYNIRSVVVFPPGGTAWASLHISSLLQGKQQICDGFIWALTIALLQCPAGIDPTISNTEGTYQGMFSSCGWTSSKPIREDVTYECISSLAEKPCSALDRIGIPDLFNARLKILLFTYQPYQFTYLLSSKIEATRETAISILSCWIETLIFVAGIHLHISSVHACTTRARNFAIVHRHSNTFPCAHIWWHFREYCYVIT